MTVAIPLTRGFVAIVDDDDEAHLSRYKWAAFVGKHTTYAVATMVVCDGYRKIFMHNLILGSVLPWLRPDHRDGNGLNNRRENLRIVTPGQNSLNTIKGAGFYEYKGVSLFKKGTGKKPWGARTGFEGRMLFLGLFATEAEAALARDAFLRERCGNFATYNFPLPGERSALSGLIEPLPEQPVA